MRPHPTDGNRPTMGTPAVQPVPDHGHRRFSAILRLTRACFQPYDADPPNHHARGFLFGRDEQPYRATLSYDSDHCLVHLQVRLGRTPPLSGRDYEALMRVQRGLNYSKVDYDPEERLLALVAAPTCLDPASDGQAVRIAIKELQKAVTDDRLLSLVSKRVAPRGKEPNRAYRKEKKS